MSNKKDLHRTLCMAAARHLHKSGMCGMNQQKYVAVELVTYGREVADVWGTNGASTTVVEVKVSRADFSVIKKRSAGRLNLKAWETFVGISPCRESLRKRNCLKIGDW